MVLFLALLEPRNVALEDVHAPLAPQDWSKVKHTNQFNFSLAQWAQSLAPCALLKQSARAGATTNRVVAWIKTNVWLSFQTDATGLATFGKIRFAIDVEHRRTPRTTASREWVCNLAFRSWLLRRWSWRSLCLRCAPICCRNGATAIGTGAVDISPSGCSAATAKQEIIVAKHSHAVTEHVVVRPIQNIVVALHDRIIDMQSSTGSRIDGLARRRRHGCSNAVTHS